MVRTCVKRGTCACMAIVLCALLVPAESMLATGGGQAADYAYADTLEELEQKVTDSSAAYNSAVERQEELASEISELDSKIAELEATLPAQQERSDKSYKALYKYQSDTTSVISMFLCSDNLSDALALVDQYDWVIEHNTEEIEKTLAMESELEASREQLESDKAAADDAAAEALATLQEAQTAREKAKEEALAAQKAEEEAKQQEAAQKLAEATTEDEKQAAQEEASMSSQASSSSSASEVGWSASKTEFVEEWAARINKYLAGSPTAGTGEYYAAAAWDYGVDPRWAPAISLVESGKGAKCFRSYNAWGFGSKGFSSWKEGIYTVVKKLGSSTYGGYLTRAAAATYCPPTANDWYNKVAAQMAKI